MSLLRSLFLWASLALLAVGLRAETLPPKPALYFNDYAGLASPQRAAAFNRRLEQFERDTSNQFLVAIFPSFDSASSVEDYTVRVAESWQVGQKGKNNGVVLFLFMAQHKVYVQVGYGLEGALPDALCHQIIENEIKPRFRAGDYDGGLDSALNAIIAAAKGEYRGTGRTHAEISGNLPVPVLIVFFVIFGLGIFAVRSSVKSQSFTYGRRRTLGGGTYSNWGGSGWTSGGSSGSSFGGGFSSGGGSFGGGGSGGSW